MITNAEIMKNAIAHGMKKGEKLQPRDTFAAIMHERKNGLLKRKDGTVVKSIEEAKAIANSETKAKT
jgi:hypothetical protein